MITLATVSRPGEQAYADRVTGSEDGADPTVGAPARGSGATVITDARVSTSAEMSSRMKRYAITMAFRTACFISMVFVRGPLLWVLFACAVFLPYVAVVVANQANQRTKKGSVSTAEPSAAPQLTTGKVQIIPGETISGEVVTGDVLDDRDGDGPDRRQRVA